MHFKDGAPQVKLSNGAIASGSVRHSRDGRTFSSFDGIPYAKIPGRFQPSELINGGGWDKTEVFQATTPGPLCPQPMAPPERWSELECLNLNVYVPPKGTKSSLPVMVWIHGGAFMFGNGSDYGPHYFMDEDVILVTLNYRLGVFGFLSTGDQVAPGNLGLKDQVMALRWVQENIQAFGGNPEKVTIFGESAGSVSVHYLMLSPLAEGLFHRAISQSGTALAPWAFHPEPKEEARNLAKFLGQTETKLESSEEIVKFLKDQPVEKLVQAQMGFKAKAGDQWPPTTIPFAFGPVKEPEMGESPAFLTKSPWEAVTERKLKVPWLMGCNEDEGCSFYAGIVLNHPKLLEELDSDWEKVAPVAFELKKLCCGNESRIPEVTEKIRKFYFGAKKICTETRAALTNLYSDIYFVYSVYKAAMMETEKRDAFGEGLPVYLYQYAHQGPGSLFKLMGVPMTEEEAKKVGHGDELLLQFSFDNLKSDLLLQKQRRQEEFSRNFVKLWVSFAVHGKPMHVWGTGPETVGQIEPVAKETPIKWHCLTGNDVRVIQGGSLQKRMEFCDKEIWRK